MALTYTHRGWISPAALPLSRVAKLVWILLQKFLLCVILLSTCTRMCTSLCHWLFWMLKLKKKYIKSWQFKNPIVFLLILGFDREFWAKALPWLATILARRCIYTVTKVRLSRKAFCKQHSIVNYFNICFFSQVNTSTAEIRTIFPPFELFTDTVYYC